MPSSTVIRRAVVETRTGSVYAVEEREEGFYLEAQNTVHVGLPSIAGQSWEIHPPTPWPPVVGRSLLIFGRGDAAMRTVGDPRHTSRVEVVRELIGFDDADDA